MKDEGILDTAKDLVTKAQFAQGWTRVLGEGNPYYYIALFFAQLRNLQSIRLDYVLARNYGYLGHTLKHALLTAPADILSSFNKLAVVEYDGYLPANFHIANPGGTNLYLRPEPWCQTSLAWFLLPSLQSLEARVEDRELRDLLTMVKGPNARTHNLAHLRRLVIRGCRAKEKRIAELLSLTRSITSLHLGLDSWYSRDGQASMKPLTDGTTLLKSLFNLKGTLRDLSIGLNLLSTQVTDSNSLKVCLAPFYGF
ncbi:hypothetical protein N7492_008268 [Penicillium capsulatum]|uniref:Uncharacterized protein n=1 Tax=Penicillium capsulatum TaxID=69766 RepID=A0A9W9HSC9_9EURO|nr:hypothetical protein N7492_008268 [Penicillium capsulatum]